LLIAPLSNVHAQRVQAPATQNAPQSTQQRAEQLRQVVALVTDPDREQRLANIEAIVAEGDVRKIEIAIRTAVASDDPVTRGIGMRAYIASTRVLHMEVELPPDVMKVVEELRNTQNGLRSARAPYAYLQSLSMAQFKIDLHFEETDIRAPRGVLFAGMVNPEYRGDFSVRGDRLTSSLRTRIGPWTYDCSFDIRPTTELNIVGTMKCNHQEYTRTINLIAPMF